MQQSRQQSFTLLLGGKPLNNVGARKTLAMRLQKRAVPFVPICAFGFDLDEAGPETNGGRSRKDYGRCNCGGS